MTPKTGEKTIRPVITDDKRKSLELEYSTAQKFFEGTNTRIWQTFSMVDALALTGLAFIGTLKTNTASGIIRLTWPITMGIGFPIIATLLGWLAIAYRWEDYAKVTLYRMEEIEEQLGIYRVRYSNWLRNGPKGARLGALDAEGRIRYSSLVKAFPRFPGLLWNQRRFITSIVGLLILIWAFFIVVDYFHIW